MFPRVSPPAHSSFTPAIPPCAAHKNTMLDHQDNTYSIFSTTVPSLYQKGLLPLQRKKKTLTDVTHHIVDKAIPSNTIFSSMFPNNLIIFPVVFQNMKLMDCLALSSSLSWHFILLKTFVLSSPVLIPAFFRSSTTLIFQQLLQRTSRQDNLKNLYMSNIEI